MAALAGIEVWIVDALRYRPHPSHLSVDRALAWIERIEPRRAILTNLHSDLDYETLRARLPAHVEPAFDGLSADAAGAGRLSLDLPTDRNRTAFDFIELLHIPPTLEFRG